MSRLVWFVFGGFAASWWLKHNETRESGHWGYCARKDRTQSPLQSKANSAMQPAEGSPAQSYAGRNLTETQWEDEKERMLTLGRQASDTMAEMSEATLDSVLSTVEALKAKLAEHRAHREAQRPVQAQFEEQSK